MLAPCHSYLLTPSAPLGADRLIGSHCSTSESEEGKLRPLPCSLASFFHFTAFFSWVPSPYSLLVLIFYLLFSVHCSLLILSMSHHLLCPLISCSLPLCAPPSHRAVSSLPLPGSSLQCICHSHSLSFFISRLYVSVYPGLQCHKQLGRSHSLLLHLLAWSPISLYQHCHLFFYIVPPLPLSLAFAPSVCVITFIYPWIRPLS